MHASEMYSKEVMVQKIFKELTTTVGDYSQALPKITIRSQKRFGASYRRSENTIFIEQAALDVCASFGADEESAIAFLLGHELTHYYQKHDWQEKGFTTGFLTTQSTFQKNIQHEKEADMYSAFITHLTGYNSIKILPDLLERIYVAYALKDKTLSSYPPLAERKSLAHSVCKTVQGLIDIYQSANYLFVLGKYEEALVSYEYLLKYIKYKELYNNIGLCALYITLPITRRDFPFVYPLTLDPTIPLRAPNGFTKEELIQKAIHNFSIATSYDASYFLSYLNLICAYDLNNQYQEASRLLNEIRPLATQAKQRQQLLIIEGIIAFRQQHKKLTRDYFSQIGNQTDFPDLERIAQLNLEILDGYSLPEPVSQDQPFVEDKIGNVNLLFYENEENSFILRDLPLDKQSVAIQKLAESKVYIFNTNQKITKFQFTSSVQSTTKQGIRIGSDSKYIQSVYPNTKKKWISHIHGTYLLLAAKGLIFDLNHNNQVVEWGIFIE